MSWGSRSRTIISRIICATPRTEGEDDAAYKKRLKKALVEGYPYAQRSGFAYQSWLRQRRQILYEMGLESTPSKPYQAKSKTPPPTPEVEGQLSLLELH